MLVVNSIGIWIEGELGTHFGTYEAERARSCCNYIDENTIMEAVINYDSDSSNEQRIWRTVIQKVIVQSGHLLEFHMIDGSKTEYRMMKTSPRMSKPTMCAKEDIRNDYANGYRVDFLAKKYGFSTSTINRILKETNKTR